MVFGACLVFRLRAEHLALDCHASRQVLHAHSGLQLVHVLPTCTASHGDYCRCRSKFCPFAISHSLQVTHCSHRRRCPDCQQLRACCASFYFGLSNPVLPALVGWPASAALLAQLTACRSTVSSKETVAKGAPAPPDRMVVTSRSFSGTLISAAFSPAAAQPPARPLSLGELALASAESTSALTRPRISCCTLPCNRSCALLLPRSQPCTGALSCQQATPCRIPAPEAAAHVRVPHTHTLLVHM